MSYHAIAIDAMLFFFNIPELSCISGKDIPSLAIHMGAAGRPEAFFPGFGWISGENRSRKVRLQPMFLVGVLSIADPYEPLALDEHRRSIVGLGVWPSHDRLDDGASPNVLLLSDFGACRSQCGYWCELCPAHATVNGPRGNQVVWYTYPPQYYQTAYAVQNPQTIVAPQYYQPTYQTQSVQAPSDASGHFNHDTTSNAAPAATVRGSHGSW